MRKWFFFVLVAVLLLLPCVRVWASALSTIDAINQPCVTFQVAKDANDAAQANCDGTRRTEYYHICRGEQVNNTVVQTDHDAFPGLACVSATQLKTEQAAAAVTAVANHVTTSKGFSFMPLLVFLVIVLFFYRTFFFTVEQQTAVVVERWRKFNRVEHTGPHFKIPFIERVLGPVELQVLQEEIEVKTKTKDDVTVRMKVMLQYKAIRDMIKEAYYELDDPVDQIKAYVFDAIRSNVPSMTLDSVYADRDLDKSIEDEVKEKMRAYGWDIIDAPITDIDPDGAVVDAMNEVNTNERQLAAKRFKAEGDKVTVVKEAEAQADAQALQGDGVARENLAIARGLVEAAKLVKESGIEIPVEHIMEMLLMTKHIGMVEKVGGGKSSTILLPYQPGDISALGAQIRNAVITGNKVA